MQFSSAYRLIPEKFRKKSWLLISLLMAGSILDFFSLASFLPLILVVSNPEAMQTNPLLRNLQDFLDVQNTTSFGILLTLFAIGFVLFKTLIIRWISDYKSRYAYAIAAELAAASMSRFFERPYTRFVQTDVTTEMNRISNVPVIFTNNFIIPAGTILSESFLCCILLICLAVLNLKIFVFIALIIAISVLLFKAARKKIENSTEEVRTSYPKLLKAAAQAIEGYIEITTLQKREYFEKKFRKAHDNLGRVLINDHNAVAGASRMTELAVAVCMGALIIITLLSNNTQHTALVTLSIYAGAGFRIIPSANRILVAFTQIKSHEYSIHELSEMIKPVSADTLSPSAREKISFQHQIKLSGISFAHPDQSFIFQHADLTIRKGEKIILQGKSGLGKTTLFLLLLRFLKEQSGSIEVDGQVLSEKNTASWQRLIGYVPQNPYILDGSVLDNIAFGVVPESINHTKVKELIAKLDLEDWINNLPNGLNTSIGERGIRISGGQRQRLAIARALYHDAEILLLDEITNHLDRETEQEVQHALKQEIIAGKTIILITHRPELWEFFDTSYEVKAGKFSVAR